MKLQHNWSRASLVLALAVFLVGPAGIRADGPTPDCYVLSVGVDSYAKANPLKGCVNDARDLAAQFVGQQGKVFGKVTSRVLTDASATKAAIARDLAQLATAAKAGDFAVLFFSGHGDRTQGNQAWCFLPHDYDRQRHSATALTDRELLARADALTGRGLKVLLIVDACFAGQLRHSARDSLKRPTNPQGGGLILMLSSMPSQTSAALGQYSAFARAVVEGLAGEADMDGDGFVTLKELRLFAYERTYQLLKQRGLKVDQDGECHWSLSLSDGMRLTKAGPRVAARPPETPPTATNSPTTDWVGSEDLGGYGRLAFRFLSSKRVVMIDSDGKTEGKWSQKGSQVTLSFDAGQLVYTGTFNGPTLSGTASNGRTTWNWTVSRPTVQAAQK